MGKILKLLLVLFIVSIGMNTLVYAKTKEVNYQKIDTYLKKEFEKAHIPGASVIFVDKEKVLFSNTYGNCKSTDQTFILGSVSKSFTALSIMQLVEKGDLKLNDPVSKYLPNRNIDTKVTIKNLLNHTSGIETYQTLDKVKVTDAYGKWVYSNLNYSLLGEIIEKVSGISYEDYIKEDIFKPIGMNNSYTSLEEAKQNELIDGYKNYFGFMVAKESPYPSGAEDEWLSTPAGYIISSTNDMGKYLQMYLNNGENIVSSNGIKSLFYDCIKMDEKTKYAMGWMSGSKNNESVVEHSGLVENYSSYMFVLPESNIACMILVNFNDFFVANNIMNSINKGVVLSTFDEKPEEYSDNYYITSHIKYNLIYLCVFIISILPLIFIKKWKRKINVNFILIHIMIPSLYLLFPSFLGVKMFVVKSFVPDLYLTIVISALILYLTGIIKFILIFRNNKRV